MKIRVGFGYDMHRLAQGRALWMGGVCLEFEKGLVGHSDADVLIHAVCDALLGAANLRDIGFHFPDNSEQYRDIDSKVLLAKTVELLREKGYEPGNIDATICAEQPRMNPHIPRMRETMARVMGIDAQEVSIKATTSEKMGFVGRQEGITAYAVALVYKE